MIIFKRILVNKLNYKDQGVDHLKDIVIKVSLQS